LKRGELKRKKEGVWGKKENKITGGWGGRRPKTKRIIRTGTRYIKDWFASLLITVATFFLLRGVKKKEKKRERGARKGKGKSS